MDEGLRGYFTPVRFLSLADDLKGLASRAVWVGACSRHVHPMVIAGSSLCVLRQRLEVLLKSSAHTTAATVVRFRV